MKRLICFVPLLFLLLGCSYGYGNPKGSTSEGVVRHALKSLYQTKDVSSIARFWTNDFRLHTKEIESGNKATLRRIVKKTNHLEIFRLFSDGDYVITHSRRKLGDEPQIGFQIFRVFDGKIAEQWEAWQPEAKVANPSGHSMVDGWLQNGDQAYTAENKALVAGLIKDIFIEGKMDLLPTYIDNQTYTQHNPDIGDGLDGLQKGMQELGEKGIIMTFEKLYRVFGEGHFSLVVSNGMYGKKRVTYLDLFRVKNKKLVEHWDVIEEVGEGHSWRFPELP